MSEKIYTCQMCGETFQNPDEGKFLVVFGIALVVHTACLENSDA